MPTDPNIRLPAEWEEQEAIQLTWPHSGTDWAPWLDAVTPIFHQIVSCTIMHQEVVIAADPTIYESLKAYYSKHSRVHVVEVATNDTWARDHGPITVLANDTRHILDYEFNGWGAKYGANFDNQITEKLHSRSTWKNTTISKPGWILEGGSIESDGMGTCLTTTRCLLNTNRNPDLTRIDIEQRLREELGITRTLWLSEGYLEGDDTDAHIDTLARFCSIDSIAYVHCDDPLDPQYPSLNAMKNELQQLSQTDGAPYRLIPLPMVEPCFNSENDLLPATYANFLIINDAVLFPIYGVETDHLALLQIRKAFPNRIIYPINCRLIIEQYGSLHCLTMQIPQVPSNES